MNFALCGDKGWLEMGRSYSASHRWHGDRGALQCGVFSFPLGGDSFNLGVELDALGRDKSRHKKRNASVKI